MTCSIPKSLTLQNVAIRMIYSNEISAIIPEAADGRKSVSGGLLFLDLLELSDPPKVVNNWTISQGTLAFKLVSGRTNIVKVPYPKKRDEMEESKIDDSVNSFQVGLRIPNYSANSKIMFWNESAKDWDSDGIRDQQFDPITKKLSFWTSRFAPHALIQVTEYLIKDLYAEFPYKNWSIEPRNRGIVLTIEGQNNQVSIQVAENGDCNAVGVSEVAETYAPSLLLKKLSQSGLSFIAPPESTVPQLLSKVINY